MIEVIKKRERSKACEIIISSVVFFLIVNSALTHIYNVPSQSLRHVLCVPMQQTARYVKYHGDEVTKDEKKTINTVLEYDKIAQQYDPRIVDYIKIIYKENGDIGKYLLVWLKQFFRHPGCYIAAYTEQFYYIFSYEASADNISLYRDVYGGYEGGRPSGVSAREPFSNPPALNKFKVWIVDVCNGLHHNLITGTLSNLSLNVYVFLVLIAIVISRKKKGLVPFVPSLVALFFALVGPVIFAHPRYLFPLSYNILILIGYVSYVLRENNVDSNGERIHA